MQQACRCSAGGYDSATSQDTCTRRGNRPRDHDALKPLLSKTRRVINAHLFGQMSIDEILWHSRLFRFARTQLRSHRICFGCRIVYNLGKRDKRTPSAQAQLSSAHDYRVSRASCNCRSRLVYTQQAHGQLSLTHYCYDAHQYDRTSRQSICPRDVDTHSFHAIARLEASAHCK